MAANTLLAHPVVGRSATPARAEYPQRPVTAANVEHPGNADPETHRIGRVNSQSRGFGVGGVGIPPPGAREGGFRRPYPGMEGGQ